MWALQPEKIEDWLRGFGGSVFVHARPSGSLFYWITIIHFFLIVLTILHKVARGYAHMHGYLLLVLPRLRACPVKSRNNFLWYINEFVV